MNKVTKRNDARIAIVIPAFKPDFLQQTLDSILKQKEKNFNVYIGNDNSPYDLESIIKPYIHQLHIIYHKFENNIGGISLTKHWERCIKLSHEPIIWLFSDDDIMPQDGVNRILEAISVYGDSKVLFRFPLNVIDENNQVIYSPLETNKHSFSGYDFLINKLQGRIQSAACEFVFSRDVFDNNKGFIEYPIAWCSDDATWIQFANYTGKIIMLPGLPVSWRNATNKNISNSSKYNKQKIIATTLFIKWILVQYNNKIKDSKFINAIYTYIYTIIRYSIKKDITILELYKLCKVIAKYKFSLSIRIFYRHCFKIKLFRK